MKVWSVTIFRFQLTKEGVSKCKFRHTLLSRVRVSKMQGAEIEDDGSVLKYMTKSEFEKQRSSLLIMTQRLYFSFATGASEITSSNRCS